LTKIVLHAGFALLFHGLFAEARSRHSRHGKPNYHPWHAHCLLTSSKERRLGMNSDRLGGPGSTDKPLGDAGSGASGGGSLGNQPGPGAATGGDPAQGVRQPTSGETEKSPAQHRPKQEIPPESGNGTESSGNDDALKRG
jgi:hypothetical protein